MQYSWISAFLVAGSLMLSGCQQITPKTNELTQNSQAKIQFSLNGKIGVRSAQQSGSAFFTWDQQDENFAIELTGILGLGKTQIEGKPGQVTLNSAKTGEISASSAEELLYRATGWQAPISHLIHWTQARPASINAQITRDASGRMLQLIEDGWQVDLSYAANSSLPNKLIMLQLQPSLNDSNASNIQNRITMLIQNRVI